MNNCPKCGNPLQQGTTSCPICGTAIASNSNVATQMTVASVSAPVQNDNNVIVAQPVQPQVPSQVTPVVIPQSAEPQIAKVPQQEPIPVVVTEDVVEPQKVDVQPQMEMQATIQSVQPEVSQQVVEPTVVQVSAPEMAFQKPEQVPQTVQQVVPQQMNPVQQPVSTIQVEQQPQVVGEQPVQNVVPVQVVQSNEQVVSQGPVVVSTNETQPVQNTSVPVQNNVPINNVGTEKVADAKVKPDKKEKTKKEKKPFNKNILIILAALIVVALAGCYMMFGNKKTGGQNGNGEDKKVSLGDNVVSSNGYKFTLADGWIVTEGNGNVIVTSTENDSTVRMKFSHSTANIENIDEELIQKYVDNNDNIKDAKIEKTSISDKNTYILNANINDLPTQTYFIGGGSRLLIGVTVIYDSADTKKDKEPYVKEMIGTLSYADDSLKAINVVDMYRDIFSVYGGVVTYSNLAFIDDDGRSREVDNNVDGEVEQSSNEDVQQSGSNEQEGTTNDEPQPSLD